MVAVSRDTDPSGPRRSRRTPVAHAPVGFETLADAPATAAAYAEYISRAGLAEATKRGYATKTRAFATWLAEQKVHSPVDVFTDPMSRDFAVRDWRTHLLHDVGMTPGSVDSYLSGLNGMLQWLGVGASTVSRVATNDADDYGQRLTPEQYRAIMRAAERRGPRDLAIVALMRLNGLRVGEVHRLNTDDFVITARTGPLQVRGKGDKTRVVHMGSRMREVMSAWVAERRTWPTASTKRALFLAQRGGRLAVRSVREVVYAVARDAGVEDVHLHPHLLRHAFAHAYLEGGGLVTELQGDLGHASLATTAIYTRPTAEERATATERAAADW